MEKKESSEKQLEGIINGLSEIFNRTFTKENIVEEIQTMLNAKDLQIADLENKLPKNQRALGIVTGEDVIKNLRSEGVKI